MSISRLLLRLALGRRLPVTSGELRVRGAAAHTQEEREHADALRRRLLVGQELPQYGGIELLGALDDVGVRGASELHERGIASKRWKTRKGHHRGGQPLSRGALYYLLRNRIYLGEIGRVRRTEQIVLVGQVPMEGTTVKWALTRIEG